MLCRAEERAERAFEFAMPRRILDDPSNPFTELEIITNNFQAKPFFERLLQQTGVPGSVVVK